MKDEGDSWTCSACGKTLKQHSCPTYIGDLQSKYNELLMAVERKHENETRHETALRYIRQTEKREQFGGDTGSTELLKILTINEQPPMLTMQQEADEIKASQSTQTIQPTTQNKPKRNYENIRPN